jgi:hypothetical protein
MEVLQPSNVTFVTSFIDIYDKPYVNKNYSWRFSKFREIAETGVQICVYVNMNCLDLMSEMCKEFPNIKMMKVITIEFSWVGKICEQYDDIRLPSRRNLEKDTKEYMILMNSKIEYLYDAISRNPFNSTHFAWVDFNLSHVLFDLKRSQERLRTMSQRTLKKKFIAFSGCWPAASINDKIEVIEPIIDEIHWRFCGGFFIGDKESMIEMYDMYKLHFPYFMFKYRTLVWEVNFWAWLEATSHYRSPTKWEPTWFNGDHNDSIIKIPADLCSPSLAEFTKKTVYNYPEIRDFVPGSASYLYFKGKHYLNTRYMNYTLTPAGYYIFNHPDKCIITRNMMSVLEDEYLTPVSYDNMSNPTDEELPSTACGFHGLEDIRLYEFNDEIKFIATTINYSPSGKGRMVIGKYDVENKRLSSPKLVEPPTDTWCEKNWIPVIRGVDGGFEEWFIYRWSPMELGRVIDGKLNIELSYPILSPMFQQFRGSSVFVDWDADHLVGVVHFSENDGPRHYYHSLVMLEKQTFRPVKYTQNFCFEKQGIEFCVGFSIKDDKYNFWISQFDRDPLLVSLNVNSLPFCFSVI